MENGDYSSQLEVVKKLVYHYTDESTDVTYTEFSSFVKNDSEETLTISCTLDTHDEDVKPAFQENRLTSDTVAPGETVEFGWTFMDVNIKDIKKCDVTPSTKRENDLMATISVFNRRMLI